MLNYSFSFPTTYEFSPFFHSLLSVGSIPFRWQLLLEQAWSSRQQSSVMTIADSAIRSVLDLLLPKLERRLAARGSSPLIIGLSGLQGSGKSTWANTLSLALQRHHLKVVNVSIDDFYHNHETLVMLREKNPGNTQMRTRGPPGTHDEELASAFFSDLQAGKDVKVPAYDKSKFGGEGDRFPPDSWKNVSTDPPIDVVIFEGWCVGFRALQSREVEERWRRSRDEASEDLMNGQMLGRLALEHARTVNQNLRVYNNTFMKPDMFDFFVHLDTDNLRNVYQWRIDQEHKLIEAKGEGMSDQDVVEFVSGYMPSYELYLNKLNKEPVSKAGDGSCHIRVLLDVDRRVLSIKTLN